MTDLDAAISERIKGWKYRKLVRVATEISEACDGHYDYQPLALSKVLKSILIAALTGEGGEMRMMKVFDIQSPRAPEDVWNVSNTLYVELWGNGNDSYYELKVVAEPDADEHGGGYATVDELQKLMDWLRSQDAENGETVLVKHWW